MNMDRKELRERLDDALMRVEEELNGMPALEYTAAGWDRRNELMEKVRGLVAMKALFAEPVKVPHAEDRVWREILY